MKLTHKLTGAVLLATLGVAVAVPGITKAEDASPFKKGDMDIQFTRNTDEDTNTTRPVFTDTDGSEDSGIISGTITRPLESVIFGVQDVTPLSFGGHAVVNDGSARTFFAKNYVEEKGAAANHVIIKDTRSTLDHKYKLEAKITKPMTTTIEGEGDHALSGATLTYTNIGIKSTQAADLALSADTIAAPSIDVTEEGVIFINNESEGKGIGQSLIHFGVLSDVETEQTSDKSVKLTVPSDKEIIEGKYKGEVTWTMSNTL